MAIAVLAVVVGSLLVLYPIVSMMIDDATQSQVIDGYTEDVTGLDTSERDEMLAAARAYNQKLVNGNVVMTDPFDPDAQRASEEEYENALNVNGAGLMAYLDISKIDVHLPIYHGTSSEVLAIGVGHLEQTSLPVGGEGTHCVLSAHTGVSGKRLFTDLDQLETGDTFAVTVLDEQLTYQVYAVEIVEPDNTSSLAIEAGQDLVTLVTCTPRNVNSHRLLVHARRIPTPAAAETEVAPAAVDESPRWLLAALIAAAAIAVVAVVLGVRRARRARRRRAAAKHMRL